MPREIKTTIAVDGEQAFKRAINEANTSMRNLGTQLTLAQAQFKKDGDAMKLMESRSKTLTAEIGQQENIVKALEKAVEDSSKAYGENSEKTEKWEAELNRAKAKLVSLQSELTLNDQGLDRNGKAFDESSQAAADYQATLQTIGKNVSFRTVTEGISGITGVIEGAIKKVFSFAKAIRETFADAGEWADTLMTDATKYGMDVETLQRWQNAADFIDTDVNTIITARDKLGQKMKKGWKDGDINMWEMLGIDLKDAETGKWRDKMDVMWEVGETLMSMARIDGDDVRAEAYAQEVFGKSWRELLPLFQAGRKEWEKTVDEQQVVSENRVKALGELDDANQALANSWDVTKYSFLAELAPVVTDVTEAVTEMLKAFNEWMDTDEGKQAMQDLSGAIQELFSGLKDVKFKDAIDAAKTAINGIKDALVWLSDKKDDIYNALKIIAAGFGLLEVSNTVLRFLELKNGLSGLTGRRSGTETGPVTTTGSPTTTGTDVGTSTAAGAGGGWLVGVGNFLTGAAARTGSFITANSGLLGAAGDMFLNQTNTGRALRDGTDVLAGVTQDINEKAEEVKHNAETFSDDWNDVFQNNPVIKWFKDLGTNSILFWDQVWKGAGKAGEHVLGDDVTAEDVAEYIKNNPDADWRPSYMRGQTGPSVQNEENWVLGDDATAEDVLAWAAAHSKAAEAEEEVEEVNLDPVYTLAEKLEAVQDWWDAYRNAENGIEPWSEENNAFEWMKEVLGDEFSAFWDTFLEQSEGKDLRDLEELPDKFTESITGSNTLLNDAVAQLKTNVESGKTVAQTVAGMDIKKFNGLPAELQVAAQRGTAAGVSGIRVYLDGASVGRLVAPYVNAALGSMTV